MSSKWCFSLFVSILSFIACNPDLELDQQIPTEEQDEFVGALKSFKLRQETAGWEEGTFRLKIMTDDGRIIVRSADHRRSSDESEFKMSAGLKSGVYRLLSAEIELKDSKDSVMTRQYGLGGRIQIDEDQRVKLLDAYDSIMGLTRQGDTTYIISSVAHLIRLRDIANDEQTNRLLLRKNTYTQVGPIDISDVMVDRLSGWMPIGMTPTTPFRGTFVGDTLNPIKNLHINRENTIGVGLFGYVQDFTAKNVRLQDASVKGHSLTGILAGAVVTAGNSRDKSYFYDCDIIDCKLEGTVDGMSVGGVLGHADQNVDVLLLGCDLKGSTCAGAYNVGGILGGAGSFSRIFMSDCVSESSLITGRLNCVGGLIGVADTLSMSVCLNAADIVGGTDGSDRIPAIGTGGLVGGAGTASVVSCRNEGSVKGNWGTGGLVGSTRMVTDEQGSAVFGNVYFHQCFNSADVSGVNGVGGICGEAQFGGYGLYNKGKVQGNLYVGGLCGKGAIVVTRNAVNEGEVKGTSRIGGLVGQVMSGSVTLCQNMGDITADDGYAGGVIGVMGDNGLVHYCTNYASLKSSGNNPIGGIVGEIGDPRTWSKLDITYCIYGAVDMVMGPWCAGVDFAAFKTLGMIDTCINMVLSVSGFGLRTLFSYMESAKLVLSFEGCFDDATFAKIDDKITAKETLWGTETEKLLEDARDKNSFSYSLDNGLNDCLLGTQYLDNIKDNLEYADSSEAFDANCNAAVAELAGEVKAHEEIKAEVHSYISYITVFVGAIATVIGFVATSGTSLFIAATAVGAVSTFAGGVNSVCRGSDNYEENAIIISQCVNVGGISAAGGDVGGIVGVMNDHCVVNDCLNAGSGPGSFGRQIIKSVGNKCTITRNLGIAPLSGWGDDEDYGNSVFMRDYSNYMFNVNDDRCLDLSAIASPDEFKKQGWSIGDADSHWMIPGETNPHPIPNWSEMRNNE